MEVPWRGARRGTVGSVAADQSRSAEWRARRAIGLIDLTDLADDHSSAGIDQLCERAATHHTAAVCVWPEHVARCHDALAGSGVRVATVVNFPGGDDPIDDIVHCTRSALDHGADEIDVVLPYRAFLDGRPERVEGVLDAVSAIVEAPRSLKVILETGALPAERVAEAARLAIEHGADFVKTSTGKIEVGATLGAVETMLGVIAEADRPIGIKPSGGIRTLADSDAYLDLAERVMGEGWPTPSTFRFGASGLLDALLAELPDGS